MRRVKFGFCAPIFANPGMIFFRTPNLKKINWNQLKEDCLYIEEKGFDSIFVADHLFLGNEGEIWESISTIAALAGITKSIELIPIHLCNNFRNPAISAKIISTISHISGDRFSLFYDYGWRRAEFDSYNLPFGKNDNERVMQMNEGIEIISELLLNGKCSFNGEFYYINNAICKPIPKKRISIWMGETNNRLMVQSIVKNADVFNSMPCSLKDFEEKKEIIFDECKRQNRNIKTLGLSLETQILIRESVSEINDWFEEVEKLKKHNNSKDVDIIDQLKVTNPSLTQYSNKEVFLDQFIIGTPEQVISKLNDYCELGIEHFMFWFMDYPNRTSIDLFVEQVRPYLDK